jgi:hypothetical protein
MYRRMIQEFIESCKTASRAGVASHKIRQQILPDKIERLINGLDAQGFLDWIKEDREYSYYYYDAQQSGVCAKPREAAAIILEAIALDNILV